MTIYIDQIDKIGSRDIYTKWQHFTCNSIYIGSKVHKNESTTPYGGSTKVTQIAHNLQLAMYCRNDQHNCIPRSSNYHHSSTYWLPQFYLEIRMHSTKLAARKLRQYPFSAANTSQI
jgi:hypothetical protein